MDWSKVFGKGFSGIVTYLAGYALSYLAANQAQLVGWAQAAVGAAVAGGLVALSNWLKHKATPSE